MSEENKNRNKDKNRQKNTNKFNKQVNDVEFSTANSEFLNIKGKKNKRKNR